MSARNAHLAAMPHAYIIPIIDGGEGIYYGRDGKSLSVWATQGKARCGVANFTHGECDFCHQRRAILEIANAFDEYGFESACRVCLNKIFDMFESGNE